MKTFKQRQADALLELLQCHYAEDYTGTDDDMFDRTNDWIAGLSDDEVKEICLSVYRNGI